MTQFNYRNRPQLVAENPKLAQALDDIASALGNLSLFTNASPNGETPAPPQIAQLAVTAAHGIYDIALTDNAPIYRGINYFVEYSETPGFVQPHVIDLGTSRNFRGNLGNQTLYFRAYSQYPTGKPSVPVYFGSVASPNPVVGGGVFTGPNPLPSSGSGTARSDGKDGAAGFGKYVSRT